MDLRANEVGGTIGAGSARTVKELPLSSSDTQRTGLRSVEDETDETVVRLRLILPRLLECMLPHWHLMLGALVTMLFTAAVDLAPPWLIRYTIDEVLPSGDLRGVWLVAGALLGLSILAGLVNFFRRYLMPYTGQKIVFELRNAVFRHLTRLSFSFYDAARTGDIMSRVTADINVLSRFFGRLAVTVVANIVMLLGILVILFVWSWRLGVAYLLFLPILLIGVWAYAVRVRPLFERRRRQLGRLNNALQECLSGIRVVKLFGRESLEAARADRQNRAFRATGIEAARVAALWMPFASVVMGLGVALALWVGGRAVIRDAITLGTLVGLSSYMGMLMRPIRQTGMMISSIVQTAAAAERVFEVLDIEPTVKDAPDAVPLRDVEGHIRFEGVSFAYAEGEDVLSDIDLEMRPGELVALVGPSGAGKTTLVHLLLRFYDVASGRILIDGKDIRSLTVRSLRDAIGIAMQNVYLFDASIRENIAYGNPHASMQQIRWAARAVHMDSFIETLPKGYETEVGERGTRLSGGQKQRVALARVLLTDPHILVLDEPTSSVDLETERHMQEALARVWEERTTVVIAHRLWTVQQADRIVVLQNGRIVEQEHGRDGRSAHELLIEGNEHYRRLYEMQFGTETFESDLEGGW